MEGASPVAPLPSPGCYGRLLEGAKARATSELLKK